MKTFLLVLRILAIAGAAFIALFDTGFLPGVPDWAAIVVALAAAFGAGFLQVREEFEELARDLTDLFAMVQSGEIDPATFEAKVREVIDGAKSIFSALPLAFKAGG